MRKETGTRTERRDAEQTASLSSLFKFFKSLKSSSVYSGQDVYFRFFVPSVFVKARLKHIEAHLYIYYSYYKLPFSDRTLELNLSPFYKLLLFVHLISLKNYLKRKKLTAVTVFCFFQQLRCVLSCDLSHKRLQKRLQTRQAQITRHQTLSLLTQTNKIPGLINFNYIRSFICDNSLDRIRSFEPTLKSTRTDVDDKGTSLKYRQ